MSLVAGYAFVVLCYGGRRKLKHGGFRVLKKRKKCEPRVLAIFKSLSESHLLLSHRQKESHIWSTRVKE